MSGSGSGYSSIKPFPGRGGEVRLSPTFHQVLRAVRERERRSGGVYWCATLLVIRYRRSFFGELESAVSVLTIETPVAFTEPQLQRTLLWYESFLSLGYFVL